MQDLIGYDEIIESSMRLVIYESLKKIEKKGLPGGHYFVITFLTKYPDVKISKELSQRYKEEMTIAIQYQYKALKVEDKFFQIALSFGGKYETLTIPYKSITSFADPSMNFALKFSMDLDIIENNFDNITSTQKTKISSKMKNNNKIDISAKVVSLDDFRNNKNGD